MDDMSKIKSSTSLTHVACGSKLRSVVMSSMHPCLANWVAVGHVVVYYAYDAHAFRTGIKCRYCILFERYTILHYGIIVSNTTSGLNDSCGRLDYQVYVYRDS